MSLLKVNKVSPQSGTDFTLGDSGDTFTVPSGVTLTVAGTFTQTGAQTFDGGVDIDNFNINGTTITLSSGDMTLDVAGDIVLDADGGDVFVKDGGTTFGSLTNTSGNLIIKSGTTTAATFSGANVTLAGTVGSGAITSTGIVTGTAFTAGSAVLAEAELELLDGLTAGTAIASKVVTTDANIDTSGQRNLTITGELDAATLDISGAIDVAGTSNLDVVDIDGAVDMASTLQVDGVATFTAVPVFPNNTIETADIQADAITAAKIADNAVVTAGINADAVTGAEIADDAINSEHYTDGSIDTAHIADGQVTTAKLATALFTGATDIGAAIVDADLFLMDDGAGGTIRKTAASRIKTYAGSPAGTLSFQSYRSSNFTLPATTLTEIIFNAEKHDGSSKYSTSNGRYTPGVAGTYFVTVNVSYDPGGNVGNGNNAYLKIRKSGSDGTEYGQISFSGSDEQQNIGFSTSAVIVLGSSDYISCFWYGAIAGVALSVQSWFSGYRLD